jgi:predicted HTH transcriptional regulator
MMNSEQLIEIIGKGETSAVQFKEKISHRDQLIAEIVAFSNSLGGMIIVGVTDKTASWVGVSKEEIYRINEILAEVSTGQNIKPAVFTQTEVLTVNQVNIMLIYIPAGTYKPYHDNHGWIWLKNGADKRRVSDPHEVARLMQESELIYADEMIVPDTGVDDIDVEVLTNYLLKINLNKEDIDEKLKDRNALNLICRNCSILKNDHVRLGGLLVFGKDPQKYKPTFCIKAVAYVGNDIAGVVYRDSEDLTGNINELFKKGMSFFTRNLHFTQQGQNFNSEGKLEISRVALEELLQNALIHRDYFKNSPIRLFIFDNRIEIISPGKLPNSLTVDEIKYGNAVVRNDRIAAFAAKLLPYRGLGSGIRRALDAER